jgi:predicted glycoside hydrolase/deacetylase ChbG (UPF0249 family)
MTEKRYLIVNADDFGQSLGVNRGIIEAHERGIVTSASLMVRWPAAVHAANYGRAHPNLSLGLHVDLGEWAFRDETWMPFYEVGPLDDTAAVADELSRQLAIFHRLVGQDPTHLDSHQHIHHQEPVRSILVELAHQLAVPLRHHSPEVRYCGDFYGQEGTGKPLPENISVDTLLNILAALPPGITELGCHPGDGRGLDSMYRNERIVEVGVLCHPRIHEAIVAMGIELRSFHGMISRTMVDPNFHVVEAATGDEHRGK